MTRILPFLVQFYVANHAVFGDTFQPPKKVAGDTKTFFKSDSRPQIIRTWLIIRAFKVEKKLNSRAQYSSNQGIYIYNVHK